MFHGCGPFWEPRSAGDRAAGHRVELAAGPRCRRGDPGPDGHEVHPFTPDRRGRTSWAGSGRAWAPGRGQAPLRNDNVTTTNHPVRSTAFTPSHRPRYYEPVCRIAGSHQRKLNLPNQHHPAGHLPAGHHPPRMPRLHHPPSRATVRSAAVVPAGYRGPNERVRKSARSSLSGKR